MQKIYILLLFGGYILSSCSKKDGSGGIAGTGSNSGTTSGCVISQINFENPISMAPEQFRFSYDNAWLLKSIGFYEVYPADRFVSGFHFTYNSMGQISGFDSLPGMYIYNPDGTLYQYHYIRQLDSTTYTYYYNSLKQIIKYKSDWISNGQHFINYNSLTYDTRGNVILSVTKNSAGISVDSTIMQYDTHKNPYINMNKFLFSGNDYSNWGSNNLIYRFGYIGQNLNSTTAVHYTYNSSDFVSYEEDSSSYPIGVRYSDKTYTYKCK